MVPCGAHPPSCRSSAASGAGTHSGFALGAALATALPALTFLDVSGNQFGEAGLRALARGIAAHARLRALRLADCGLATMEKRVRAVIMWLVVG